MKKNYDMQKTYDILFEDNKKYEKAYTCGTTKDCVDLENNLIGAYQAFPLHMKDKLLLN